jgi:serine/threonine protein kinase
MAAENQTGATSATTLRPGQIVGGNYRIERLIGKGGMAAVWEATNQRTGKRVALKAILNSSATPAAAADMLRLEALASSRVNHPNVVNIYDVIDHEHLTCIVMEMLDGEPLSAYLARKGFVGVEEAATLLLPAMRGVAAANAMGVIHRDLKPQNIFLCLGSDGRLLTTKVLDFGIAVMMEKTWGSPSAAPVLPTHGTPAYMSPEHIQGLANIDARADVYGFGVLLFEALSGQLPFLGEPSQALLTRILGEPAPKLTLFRPDLPAPVVAIVERAMAKDPGDRFPDLEPFIAALEGQLLPSSGLPRSLTPMAGVPLFSLAEPRSGVADSVVQIMHRNEPSGPREPADTKELYTLGREPDGGAAAASRKVVLVRPARETPPVGTQAGSRPASGIEFRRWLVRRAASFAMFAGVLLLVAWLSFPNLSALQAIDEPPPGGMARRVTPPVGEQPTQGAVIAPTLPSEGVVLSAPDGGL